LSKAKRIVGRLVATICVALGAGCAHRSETTVSTALASDHAPAQAGAASHTETGAQFVDVAATAGLKYRWEVAGKRPLTILQTIGNGCAFLDYDNDGNQDILLVGPRLALYRGDGKGKFTDVTASTGLDRLRGRFLGCGVGDYDNDGFDDIYITAYRGGMLLHNQQGRGFRDVTREAGIAPQPWGTSCTFADVDGDGRLDLYICNYARFGPDTRQQLCLYNGLQSACGPRFYAPEKGTLYHNEGGGRFRDTTREWGLNAVQGKALGVAAADYDGRGRPGIAIANDEMGGDLCDNFGHGMRLVGAKSGTAYDASGNVHGGMGLDWGDFDNDGRLDLAVATFQHEAKSLYHNDGRGLFTDVAADAGLAEATVPSVAFGVKFLDFDNDGVLDLIYANGHVQDNIAEIDRTTTYRQHVQLLRGQAGRFEDVSAVAGEPFGRAIVGRGLATADFDNDGRVDVLVVDSEGAPLLLHNETPQAGHWIAVRLTGTRSNRDGIGALVTVTTDRGKQMRLCHADGSYLSSSDRRVHVGLGASRTATVAVRWPSGHTDVRRNVDADRVISITEGGQ
jgi:hypothetical protein